MNIELTQEVEIVRIVFDFLFFNNGIFFSNLLPKAHNKNVEMEIIFFAVFFYSELTFTKYGR